MTAPFTRFFPRGFHCITTDELRFRSQLITFLCDAASQKGIECVEFPILGLLENARKGAEIVGEKAYTFLDRKGRPLLLNSDACAPLLLHHLMTRKSDPGTYYWLSPTIRYRNVRRRHWTQLGIAGLNTPDRLDKAFLECFTTYVSLVSRYSPGGASVKVFHAERRSELAMDRQRVADTMVRTAHASGLTSEFIGVHDHSKEILTDLGCLVTDTTGTRMGDGGFYSEYATRFSDGIVKRMFSLCVNVERLGGFL